MCSGCRGSYEGDGDGWEVRSEGAGDTRDDGPLEGVESARWELLGIAGRDGTGEPGNRVRDLDPSLVFSLEVFVVAVEIIERYRIIGAFRGLP